VSSQQGAQSELPVILSLTNVAVSKQKALLHATQASQVHSAGNSTAASRIRQHALHTLAQSRHQTGSQADQSTAVQASNVLGYRRVMLLDSCLWPVAASTSGLCWFLLTFWSRNRFLGCTDLQNLAFAALCSVHSMLHCLNATAVGNIRLDLTMHVQLDHCQAKVLACACETPFAWACEPPSPPCPAIIVVPYYFQRLAPGHIACCIECVVPSY